jgi:hypothetical protein
MAIPVFKGEDDAYQWVLCTEQHFKEQNIVENAQLTVAVKALQGRALRWWLWRSHRQLPTTWDAFTTIFLWRFKPEWRDYC